MSLSDVMPEGSNTWKVCSATDPSNFYIVMLSEFNCECKLKWNEVELKCDGIFSVTASKHAHLVQRFRKPENVPDIDNIERSSGSEFLSFVRKESNDPKLTEHWEIMSNQIRVNLPYVTKPENQMIVREVHLVKALSDENSCNEFVRTTDGPNNKNLEPRLRFDRPQKKPE